MSMSIHTYTGEGVYQIPEELIRFLRAGDTDGSEMLNISVRNLVQIFWKKKQYALLTDVLSLKPLKGVFNSILSFPDLDIHATEILVRSQKYYKLRLKDPLLVRLW